MFLEYVEYFQCCNMMEDLAYTYMLVELFSHGSVIWIPVMEGKDQRHWLRVCP
jgi:hypothetical protein